MNPDREELVEAAEGALQLPPGRCHERYRQMIGAMRRISANRRIPQPDREVAAVFEAVLAASLRRAGFNG